ncbi:MAG: TraR/DksA C4-type zinc finger protein [Bdellovibrionaceae bacterium]|nr:TraR/DksA C4-type zinc finger protein [Pseudobdellovibrionaceae bacterium]MDW8190999.1 TraR/DksA C4-type zinc finger protein [Pseudobdellovibrionaceae bacterium]
MHHTLSPEFIEECRQELVELKTHLLNRLSYLRNELGNIERQCSEEGDLSTTQVAEHQIYVNHRRLRYLLNEVEEALKRIEEGTFGYCEETGEVIEKERLKLMPYTRLSVEGAEIRDTRRQFIG